jgi:hypothetical protein
MLGQGNEELEKMESSGLCCGGGADYNRPSSGWLSVLSRKLEPW